MPTAEAVIEQCAGDDLALVRVLYVDSGGVTRGRVVPADDVADVIEEGANLAKAQQAFTALNFPADAGDLGGPVGEVRLVADPATFRELPYAERTAVMLGDLETLAGEPWAHDPRSRLAAVLEDTPFTPEAAFESECYLAAETDEGLVPVDRSGCFAADGMQSVHEVVLDVVDALAAQGMDLATYYPELGPGQQEIVIEHAPGLRAADDYALYRQTLKAVAGDHGLTAALLPKPFADEPGSGCHLNLSLWDGDDNVFHDPGAEGRYPLSETGRGFVGGLLAHAPALLALTAPSVVSYKRLRPRSWASAYACWGEDNREAMVRVPSADAADPAGSTRIEFKAVDNTINPYLALTGLLAAGLDGVERGLDPGEPLDRDPAALSAAERADRGVERYPETLTEALDALAENDVLEAALGTPLFESYLGVKRGLWEEYAGRVSEWERAELGGRF